ncbi:MAG: dethiobiotin synthase [Azoarcus sp.]|jgi:dethiobiotin synthetase|nr:dethiobiotin synthase [Azoarcus sp.]
MSAFRAWFVTGTDTEIGKTFATSVLIHATRSLGYTTLGMKPISAGVSTRDSGVVNDDVVRLLAASSAPPNLALINPYCLRAPISPHLAAQEEGVHIDPIRIKQTLLTLRQYCERVFIEGVGGFRVPLGEHLDTADLACALGLPMILVVGMRLGCINHALLTTEAIAARGLRLAGWIANCIDPDMDRQDENIDSLRRRIHAPFLGSLPYSPGISPAELAHLLIMPA